jgi:DNA-damage-inducible protein J
MGTTTLNIRLDSDLKERFDETADAIGITSSAAFNVFARQFVAQRGFPFDVKVPDAVPAARPLTSEAIDRAVHEAAIPIDAISKVVLFGSHARGDATAASDVDLRVVVDRSKPFSLVDLGRFQKSVERATGREVDVVSSDTIKNQRLAEAIEREGIVVYGREE